MAIPEDLSDELQRSLAVLLGDDRALRAALHPLIRGAFHRGAAFAVQQMMEIGARYLAAIEPANRPVEEPVVLAHETAAHERFSRRARPPVMRRRRRSEAKPRAVAGAVGHALDLVLTEHPGLRIVEAQSLIKELDPTISASSITNELRRKKGIRYRQEGVRWFRIGDTEKRMGSDRSLADEPDLLAGRPGLPAAAA